MMTETYMIYGAYGYTGELIARQAVEAGQKPVLAGRDPERLHRLSQELGLEYRVFKLEDPRIIEEELRPFTAVLHCAGPFLQTHGIVCRACLATQTHYLDITGEAAVFEALAARDQAARDAEIMLLPGVGFDVVPTDCLALHLKERLPASESLEGVSLALGIKTLSKPSRGTALTMAENIHRGGMIRKDGRLTPVPPAWKKRTLDFGDGKESTGVTIPWGDIATAYHSTGIGNIEVYASMPRGQRTFLSWTKVLGPLLGTGLAQFFIKNRIKAKTRTDKTRGPDATQREKGRSYLWGEITTPSGETAVTRLVTPEGYALTAATAVAIAGRVLQGESPVGFQTPAKAYGSDFITTIEGVRGFLDEE